MIARWRATNLLVCRPSATDFPLQMCLITLADARWPSCKKGSSLYCVASPFCFLPARNLLKGHPFAASRVAMFLNARHSNLPRLCGALFF
jgi:hypothetical protein